MARILRWTGVALALLLASPLVAASVRSQTPVTVSIDAPAEVAPDSDFTATVDVTEVHDFDACQFDVTYDPDVIEVTEVTSGEIGDTIIAIDIWGFVPPAEQGRARVVANVTGASGVSGSGLLAVIHFRVTGSVGDTSTIKLEEGLLGDDTATEIPATWGETTVLVSSNRLYLPLVVNSYP
jgi:hypothetical protein